MICKKFTSSEESLDQARLETGEPVSTHCTSCPVRVFQNRMQWSAVPQPLAKSPWYSDDQAIATKENAIIYQMYAKLHTINH
jgi:hypothetical protein